MAPPNNLGPDLNGKAVNETQYRGMIRSLMYLTTSRPDIQFSTCLCARYQENPKESQLIVVKRIFKYLKGTPSLGFRYPKYLGFDLKGYSDSDYAGSMSSAEADYVAAAGCCANILWMKNQLSDYDIIYEKVPIFCDNTSSIAISNNPVLHSRTKHTDIRYHFIRDHILKGDIELNFIPTQYQLADIFTKPLDEPTFKRLICEIVEHTTVHCSRKAFTRSPNQYKEYLSNFWYTAKVLKNSKYCSTPPLETVKAWFSNIRYSGEIGAKGTLRKSSLPPSNGVNIDYAKLIWEDIITKLNKKTREKVVPYPSVHNWTLKKNQPERPSFTDHILAICKAHVPVEHKAPNTSSYTRKKDSKGKNPGAKYGHKKQQTSSKHHPLSKIKAIKGGKEYVG
ncbi:hypothetical protein Tco_0836259 [Tanacetum coccineum]